MRVCKGTSTVSETRLVFFGKDKSVMEHTKMKEGLWEMRFQVIFFAKINFLFL